MNNSLTDDQKETILQNIKRIDVDKLAEYLKNGEITLQEMKETHSLSYKKREELEKVWEEVIDKRSEEQNVWNTAEDEDTLDSYKNYIGIYPDGTYYEEAQERIEEKYWENAKNVHSVESFNQYLSEYPEGKYAYEAQSKVDEIIKRRSYEKGQIIEDIKNNPNQYSATILNRYFNENKISKQDLYDNDIITPEALKVYLNPPNFLLGEEQHTWESLKEIPKGNNDVYLFGIPGSGKSCILAGMLYQADMNGILDMDTENSLGFKYADKIMKGVKLGYVPPSTSVDQVNYISCQITYKEKFEYDMSIVEMSGEFFNRTYYSDTVKGEKTIGAKGFLDNDNSKIILLVIDYDRELKGVQYDESGSPKRKLLYVLDKLDKDGTLDKTDSIQIVVSKVDLIDESIDRNEFIKEYINKNYKALINKIHKLNKKYNINHTKNHKAIIHPFSLGEFMLGKTFKFDPEDSEKLLNSIIKMSRPNRKKKWYEKLFD